MARFDAGAGLFFGFSEAAATVVAGVASARTRKLDTVRRQVG
jgi:hypothetical protein